MSSFRMSSRIVPGSLLALLASSALLAACSSSGGGLQPPAGLHYTNSAPTYSVGAPVAPDVPSVGGGAVSSWSVSPNLPAGLSLDLTSGTISGTPTVTATSQVYTVTATNSAGSTTAGVTITVGPAVTPPSGLHYASNPITYAVNVPITPNTPTSSGGQVQSYAVTPALPAGLSIDGTTGIISGTPTAAATFQTYTVTGTNPAGTTPVGLGITVSGTLQPPATLTYTSNSPTYMVGTPVQNLPTYTGGQPTSYAVGSCLPAGLSLNTTTGVISGTPTTPVTGATCAVSASNASGSAPAVTLTFTVTQAVSPPLTIAYATTTATYPAGQAIAQNAPTFTGGQPTSYVVAPSLPAGLSINTTTGVITGTPTVPVTGATCTVTASNAAGSAPPVTLTITVTMSYGQLAVMVDKQPSTSASVNIPYTAVGTGPFTVNLKGLLYQSGGVTNGTQAYVNFAAVGSGITFNNTASTALQCQVTSAQPECVMIVTLTPPAGAAPPTFQVTMTVAGAVTTVYSQYNTITVNLVPDTTPGPGTIQLSSQTAQVPTGINVPLWVTWDKPAVIGTATVSLTVSGGASFYWYNAGDNQNIQTGTTKTCSLTFNGTSTSNLHCGYGLRASVGATAGQVVTVSATASGPGGYSYPVQSLPLTVGTALPAARTVVFTNNSSQQLWVGITGGSATSWSDASTPYGAPGTTTGGRPIGGATQCGPSTVPPDAAACPAGTTCIQGGAGVTSSTGFQCFYDQGTPQPGYALAAGASTTLQISGSSLSPGGIIWSGNFYGRTGCNTTDPAQAGTCENASCVGAVPSLACGPGTGPKPGVNTLAEVTFQGNAQPDYYDVSIINGANFAVQFSPQVSGGTGYSCGAPGSAAPLPGGLPGASWQQAVASTNFPVPTNIVGDPLSYFQLVSSAATVPCSVVATDCASSPGTVCGFRVSDIAQGTFDVSSRYCGTKLGWTTADAMYGANQTATSTITPFGFTLTPTGPKVGELQLCSSTNYAIYSSYSLNWNSPTSPIQPVGLACGGAMWGPTESVNMNPSGNAGLGIINPSKPVQTANGAWITYVLPTILWMKQACPTCYSFPFDDMSSTFTCTDSTGQGLTYAVRFSDLDPPPATLR